MILQHMSVADLIDAICGFESLFCSEKKIKPNVCFWINGNIKISILYQTSPQRVKLPYDAWSNGKEHKKNQNYSPNFLPNTFQFNAA